MKRLPVFGTLLLVLVAANAPQNGSVKTSVYDETARATVDIAAALKRAQRENKRVLLDIGGNWCGWCRLLHGVFEDNQEVHSILNAEYEVVYVDIGHVDKNQALLAGYGIKPNGYPYLAVLGTDNKLVTQQETGALEDGPKHDPKKVAAFLTKWQAPALDAQNLLTNALASAAKDHKRVFVRFGAPWCGWCHKLDGVLYQPDVEAALQSEFVMLKIDIDRMANGQEVLNKYQTSPGVPWFAILTADGKVVANSDIKPNVNVGFPSEPGEVDFVVKMLTNGRKKMTDEQATAIRDAFTKATAATSSLTTAK